jgi:NTE family protein
VAVRVVAVFGGGGAKAVAHVGAQRALVEAGLAPGHFVGTSFGAVIAAALAAGEEPEALEGRLRLSAGRVDIAQVELLSLLKGFYADHLIKPAPLRDLIGQLVTPRAFAELGTPLTVTATDLDTGELALFGAGGRMDVPLQDALYASCALPLYYPPALIGGRRYGDGGLRAVLALEPARVIAAGVADLVVAVHVGPGYDEPPAARAARIPPLVRAHGDSERIMMAAQVERTIAAWPADGSAPRLVLVRPVREREATFAAENAKRYIEAGYRATQEALRHTP